MITKAKFGVTPRGDDVFAYTLTNHRGASATILNLGGILSALRIPDRDGKCDDIVAGFSTPGDYLIGGGYLGALVGRYANRIRDGRFTLNGQEYVLAKNERDVCHLHGGKEGFNAKIWDVETAENTGCDQLILRYTSPNGEEGYPGTLRVKVTYGFSNTCTLSIHYEAVSDADTVCNLTNHSYFNLGGYASGDIASHTMWIASDFYTETDDDLLPIRNVPVAGTVFDFNTARPLTGAYDHNFMLRTGSSVTKIAEVCHAKSGRRMEIATNMPAMQLYTANVLNGPIPLKGGVPQTPHTAFCVETQFAPDSPNRPEFPDCTLRAGKIYDYTTEFRFGLLA